MTPAPHHRDSNASARKQAHTTLRSTPRRIGRLLAVYTGAALQVLVLGSADGPAPSPKPSSPGAGA
ncbi:hypothetical protein [Kitasatospora sp. NPDC017646]|uniref:hypothetical protein n=1 Tax=Kitasatospora sp. NPDC017646 TaxID=3364024 RepID=UPI003797FA96